MLYSLSPSISLSLSLSLLLFPFDKSCPATIALLLNFMSINITHWSSSRPSTNQQTARTIKLFDQIRIYFTEFAIYLYINNITLYIYISVDIVAKERKRERERKKKVDQILKFILIYFLSYIVSNELNRLPPIWLCGRIQKLRYQLKFSCRFFSFLFCLL